MPLFLTNNSSQTDLIGAKIPSICVDYPGTSFSLVTEPLHPSGKYLLNVPNPFDALLADYRYPRVASTGLTDIKSAMLDAVDSKTLSLRANGFAFSPSSASGAIYHFPLDPTSSITWQGMLLAAASLNYPQKISSIEGPVAQLSSPLEVQSFFASGVTRASEILVGAAELRSAILSASSLSELDTIFDNRL
jgi:hypothetical protein